MGGHDDCRVHPDWPGNCALTRHEPSADPRDPPGRVSQRSTHLIVSAWPRSRFSRHSNSSAEIPSLHRPLAAILTPHTSRESASFACAIPASFVLSCNLPMTNARAAWLRFGAFQSPRFSSLQFHWPLFSCHSLYSPLPPDPLTTGDRPLFSLIMRPPSYRQRLFVEHDLGGSSGSAIDAARRAGYPWTEQMDRKMLRFVEKRGVQAAGNGPSEDRMCWQRVELGIHGLNRWLVKCREMSRKRGVRAARNGPIMPPPLPGARWPRRR